MCYVSPLHPFNSNHSTIISPTSPSTNPLQPKKKKKDKKKHKRKHKSKHNKDKVKEKKDPALERVLSTSTAALRDDAPETLSSDSSSNSNPATFDLTM